MGGLISKLGRKFYHVPKRKFLKQAKDYKGASAIYDLVVKAYVETPEFFHKHVIRLLDSPVKYECSFNLYSTIPSQFYSQMHPIQITSASPLYLLFDSIFYRYR